MILPSSRLLFLALFLASAGMMSFGYYLQYAKGLEPCPLCITQRIFIVACGLTGLAAFVHGPARTGARIYGAVAVVLAIGGGAFSSRQLWLQHLPPDQAPACGPNLQYLLETLPLWDALQVLLRGDGNCAEVLWTFLGVSIPGWTLVGFFGLATLAALGALQGKARSGIVSAN